ncbi:MAG: MFS transporter, partial [Dehalococcoidia bacterium]
MLRRLLPNVYEGWIVVGSSAFTVLLIAASFFYGFGTIFNEVVDEFGWSVAATSLAFSLRSEVGGLAAPFVGGLVDRLGAQRVIIAGVVVSTGGALMMSFIQEIWHFYMAMIIIACGTSAAGGQVGLAAIATWFETKRALAMSFMTVGGGLGGLLVV